mmetsp:Transcript_131926/g.232299  ORF Transcript_131926/g.232299 Transcript_131926/m.232299 type:complete len:124 (+) Transcript_131926:38-409(+)
MSVMRPSVPNLALPAMSRCSSVSSRSTVVESGSRRCSRSSSVSSVASSRRGSLHPADANTLQLPSLSRSSSCTSHRKSARHGGQYREAKRLARKMDSVAPGSPAALTLQAELETMKFRALYGD